MRNFVTRTANKVLSNDRECKGLDTQNTSNLLEICKKFKENGQLENIRVEEENVVTCLAVDGISID